MSIPRKSGTIAIVQFSPRAISIFRAKPAGTNLEVLAHEVRQGRWDEDGGESIGAGLKTLAEEMGLASDRIFVVLSRHDLTARILELPSHDDREIDGMVQLGAEDLVPYPADELVTAHSLIERLDNGASRVLVAVVHQDILSQTIATIREAGLEPERVYWSTACLLTALQSSTADRDDMWAALHIGPGGFELLVLKGANPQYTRGIGWDHVWSDDESPAILEELASELRSSLAAQRRESFDGIGASKVFVSSDAADATAIAAKLATEVDYLCEPASVEGLAAHGATIKSIPLVAWGAALTANGSRVCPIDLTPKVELQKRARASVRTKIIVCAAACAVLFIALGVLYAQAVQQRTAYIERLEAQAEALRPRVKESVAKRRHLEKLQRQVERKDTVLELLSSLAGVAPRSGLNFTSIRYRRNEGITLFGRAKTLRHIQNTAEALRAIGKSSVAHFAKASILYENPGKERGQEIYNYSIDVPFPEEVLQ